MVATAASSDDVKYEGASPSRGGLCYKGSDKPHPQDRSQAAILALAWPVVRSTNQLVTSPNTSEAGLRVSEGRCLVNLDLVHVGKNLRFGPIAHELGFWNACTTCWKVMAAGRGPQMADVLRSRAALLQPWLVGEFQSILRAGLVASWLIPLVAQSPKLHCPGAPRIANIAAPCSQNALAVYTSNSPQNDTGDILAMQMT